MTKRLQLSAVVVAEVSECDTAATPALQLGLELALRERDTALRENARAIEDRNVAQRQFEAMRLARDQALSDGRSNKPSNRWVRAMVLTSAGSFMFQLITIVGETIGWNGNDVDIITGV